jgi:cyclomaltodextrinase
VVVLFTLPGVPAVYYGDEQGFRGEKQDRPGGDDAVRPAFPANPESLAQEGWPIYRLHQNLIGLRRRHSWLTTARVEVLSLANEQFGYRALGPDGESLTVLLNIGDQPFGFTVEGSVELLLANDDVQGAADFDGLVPAHGWAIARP